MSDLKIVVKTIPDLRGRTHRSQQVVMAEDKPGATQSAMGISAMTEQCSAVPGLQVNGNISKMEVPTNTWLMMRAVALG